MIAGKRILLTGGAGFIGTALAKRLLDDNTVVVLDNCARNSLSQTDLASHPNLLFTRGDVLDLPTVQAAARGCDMIVHLAAIAGVDTVMSMPVTTMRVNIL